MPDPASRPDRTDEERCWNAAKLAGSHLMQAIEREGNADQRQHLEESLAHLNLYMAELSIRFEPPAEPLLKNSVEND
jgi:hypothetical protein